MPALGLGLGLQRIPSGFVSSGPWVDPLAGISFELRLQTHRGDGIPLGLYQDAACTIPATIEGDPVGGWRDVLGGSGLTATQSIETKRPTLVFVDGIPMIEFDGVDDNLEVPQVFAVGQSLCYYAGFDSSANTKGSFLADGDESSGISLGRGSSILENSGSNVVGLIDYRVGLPTVATNGRSCAVLVADVENSEFYARTDGLDGVAESLSYINAEPSFYIGGTSFEYNRLYQGRLVSVMVANGPRIQVVEDVVISQLLPS